MAPSVCERPGSGQADWDPFQYLKRGLVSSRPLLWILHWGQGLLPPGMREGLRCQWGNLLEDAGVCSESEGEEAGSLEFPLGKALVTPEGVCILDQQWMMDMLVAPQ